MRATMLLLLPGLLFLSACKDGGTEQSGAGGFAIYLLRDTTLTTRDVQEQSLGSLALAPSPLISERDLRAYYWTDHSLVPIPAIDTTLSRMSLLRSRTAGMPFVVMVGTERIYLGSFWWAYSSSTPQVPYIELITPGPYKIAAPPIPQKPDKRQDQRIRETLRAAGILHE